ncbi:MAG: hypothetical protein A2X82_05105 [Geobacteraceae bacterium GWC2_55_20]|nr:MAG: hypothetical protein A2X82_05105 [Geobacteraceae bacterium GWC2_55_20]OGU20982.1 MAG: hypothetical protein A2X85_05825 [Geobacteraceae bacterium GWF2_54_21]
MMVLYKVCNVREIPDGKFRTGNSGDTILNSYSLLVPVFRALTGVQEPFPNVRRKLLHRVVYLFAHVSGSHLSALLLPFQQERAPILQSVPKVA